jgi:hypothetical protein
MKGLMVLLGLVAVSGVTGYLDRSDVRADEPAACPVFDCRTLHAEWGFTRQEDALAYFEVGDVNVPTNNAQTEIFAPTSTETTPTSYSGERDMWVYKNCEPTCGRSKNTDGNMAWQWPQEVVKHGKGFQPMDSKNLRTVCTATVDGNGTQPTAQTNTNTSGLTPPGMRKDVILP